MNNQIRLRVLVASIFLMILTFFMIYIIGERILEMPRWLVLILVCVGETSIALGIFFGIRLINKKR